MGKVDENKHQKMDALFQSAYDLFLNQGIEKTSISDIAKKAGVAKGTFYLYFADKYEIRDRLIARTASRLFQRAHKALETADIPEFEDKIIFIVDYVLNAMQKNKLILRFISKNLSWVPDSDIHNAPDPEPLSSFRLLIYEFPFYASS